MTHRSLHAPCSRHARGAVLAAVLCCAPLAAVAAQLAPPRTTEVAPGVFLFQTPPYGDVGLDGNSVAIVTGDGVLVFDTNGTPAAAAAVLDEIRRITRQPVRYVVNSHWHWDHWYGTEVYRAAYPDARLVAHEKTRTLMVGPALEFNRPGLEAQLPAYIASLEKRLAAAKPSPDTDRLARLVAADRRFLAQKVGVRHTFPELTFSERLTLHLGGRRIDLVHPGRAVTPGDTFLHLPDEGILVTGDLLVNPVTFALSCYPTEWLRALERLDRLDARLIVPGHGAPLRDEGHLHATMEVFRRLLDQGRQAKTKGLGADDAREAILPGLTDLERRITGGDPALAGAFRVQLVDWFLHRVYQELDGPLDDTIGAIPPE